MYRWVVFLHVLSVLSFLLAHGVAAAVMFRVRAEREPARLRALLDLAGAFSGLSNLSVLLLLAAGLLAGFLGGWWGRGWIWVALALFIVIGTAMSFMGRVYFERVRHALGVPTAEDLKQKRAPSARPPDQLAAVLNSGQPAALAALGLGGLVVITWLMMFKPF